MAKKVNKRGNGEGSITQRPDGRWMAQITTGRNYETGKPKRVTLYGKTRKEVQEKLTETIHSCQNGTFTEPNKLTFGNWMDIWLNQYAKPHIRPTTFTSYNRWIKNHIKPALGGIYLKDLQPNQIQRFYNEKLLEKKKIKEGTISPRSVRYMHTLIQEALEQAVKEGKIIRNPAKATKPPKQERKEANYLTIEQIEEFLNSITDDRWYTAFLTVLGSGLRLGEVVALTWENIDIEKGIIYVKQAASRVDTFEATGPKTKLVFQPPKTNKGLRAIALPENVLAELKHWKIQQAQEKLLMGSGYRDQGFVFVWPDGRIVNPTTLSKHFLRLIRQHGIENIHFHSLRHSYASMLLKAGVHPKVAQENLGHSTISITLDIYSHVAPELKVAAAQQINGVLNVKRPSAVEKGK